MVSKARLLLPLPESPVMTTSRSRGSSTVMSLRLCSRAPRTMRASWGTSTVYRKMRDWNRRSKDRRWALASPARSRSGALDDIRRDASIPGRSIEPGRLPAAIIVVLIADAWQPVGGRAGVWLQGLLARGQDADLLNDGPRRLGL